MSMYDKSYCATECNDKNCERNIKFNKPETRIYSMTTFDDLDEQGNIKINHKNCKWKIKKGGK